MAGRADEIFGAFNLTMFNTILRDYFREMYMAFRNRYFTPDPVIDFVVAVTPNFTLSTLVIFPTLSAPFAQPSVTTK